MKKIILIPTDFSKNAWDAIAYTLELFKNSICDFYFLNVYNFPGFLTNSAFVTMPSNEIYDEFKLVTLSNINLLSLIIKKESFLYRLFKGSITSDICYGSHIPLLFLHQD